MSQDVVAEAATRVALLARQGAACERLQAALKDAGADVVLVSDPSQTDAAGVRDAGAQAILIALEPAVEDALDRYDALLADPAITVIFDEAELAAQREGWDAARWTRHLAAKLNRHEQVLPPGAEIEAALAAVAPPPARYERPEHDGDISAVVGEADLHAPELPRDLDATPRVHPSSMFDPVAAEMDSFELADIPAFGDLVLDDLATPEADLADTDASGASDIPFGDLVLDDVATFEADFADANASGPSDIPFGDLVLDDVAAPAAGIAQAGSQGPSDIPFGDLVLDDVAAPAAGIAQAGSQGPTDIPFGDLVLEDQGPALDVAPAATASVALDAAFADLVLEVEAPPAVDDAPAADRFRRDLDDLHLRIADMQLEDSRPARPPAGAVLVLAGLGGPDAVRQLLGELPAGFPRAVLILQRLEGGRHDKLVRQMQRATPMPVALAEPGMALQAGHVYVLPSDLGVGAGSDGLAFEPAEGVPVGEAILARLPAGDSAVVLLSGSDPGAVDAAMNHSQKGALVAGQSADGCFDATAPDAAVARGAQPGTPAQLAKMLATRWPS